jgi:hypothetical protein
MAGVLSTITTAVEESSTTIPVTMISGYAVPFATSTSSGSVAVTLFASACSPNHSSHTIAIAAGVGVAAGVVIASIMILAFVLIRRHQTRKALATISPDVLVTGPKFEEQPERAAERWMGEYREEIQHSGEDSGSFGHSQEPPAYINRG